MKANPKVAAWALASMLAIAMPLVADWEGRTNSPHWDKIGKVWDVCYGDTKVEMRTYTDAECKAMLSKRLVDYGEPVRKCVPSLEHRPFQWAASTSLAYNVGVGTFCKSSIARKFNSGDWKGGCEAFKLYVKGGGVYVQGLANRRYAGGGDRVPEYRICVAGLA